MNDSDYIDPKGYWCGGSQVRRISDNRVAVFQIAEHCSGFEYMWLLGAFGMKGGKPDESHLPVTCRMKDEDKFIDPLGYWTDAERNVRRVTEQDGQQKTIAQAASDCTKAEWDRVLRLINEGAKEFL